MEERTLKSTLRVAQFEELSVDEQRVVEVAKQSTYNSYAPYSHFHVGAALLLKNGTIIPGCNQENAAFPAGICAERAVRNSKGDFLDEPASPCGPCRQGIIETETRFKQEVRILLYGTKHTYILDGIKQLMPLSFTEI